MNTRTPTMLPQNAPSFAKALLHAFALIVGTTLLFGALWARADDPHTTGAGSASSAR